MTVWERRQREQFMTPRTWRPASTRIRSGSRGTGNVALGAGGVTRRLWPFQASADVPAFGGICAALDTGWMEQRPWTHEAPPRRRPLSSATCGIASLPLEHR